jgi:hypothetical protein
MQAIWIKPGFAIELHGTANVASRRQNGQEHHTGTLTLIGRRDIKRGL